MLMTVALRPHRVAGVVAMPYHDVLQSDGLVELFHRLAPALFGNNIVSRNPGMACVDARAHRTNRLQLLQQLSHLLERSPERELPTARVSHQHPPPRIFPLPTLPPPLHS